MATIIATLGLRYMVIVVHALALGAAVLSLGPELAGFASLSADTFLDGPTSGQLLSTTNHRTPPFVLRQPVLGISSLLVAPGTEALVLSDNGFGTKANSPDFVLAFHSLRLDYEQREVKIQRSFQLKDPHLKIPWPIVAQFDTYPGSPYPVDATIMEERLLTGWDFDPESFVQDRNGRFWFGDEFGPFLLTTDVAGRVLRAPISLPGVCTRDNPLLCTEPTLAPGRGIVGLALGKDKRYLYALLGGPLSTATDKRALLVYQFDTKRATFTGLTYTYRLEDPSHSVGEIVEIAPKRFLVVETDSGEALQARFKKVFLVDFGKRRKTEIVDLLMVLDPNDRNRDGNTLYRMPFADIGSLGVKDSRTLLVASDNNYPFNTGRFPEVPDNTEFALLRLPKPLTEY